VHHRKHSSIGRCWDDP